MRAAARLLGARQAHWAQAMQAELACARNEREALAFAWGCLGAAAGHALGRGFGAARAGWAQAHGAGAGGCAAAVLAGCAFMHNAGAPGAYVGMNLLSLALALATWGLLPRRRWQADETLRAQLACALGALLLIGSLGPGLAQSPAQSVAAAGAWLRLGPVTLNLAWLLLPALLVAAEVRPASAARPWALGAQGLALAALALQGDALLLGLMAAVLAVQAAQGRSFALALPAGAAAALAAHLAPAWQAPQTLAFVDQVVQRGFQHHWAAGLALALLQLLPLWPAWRHRRARLHGLVWGLLVAFSLPGWLPSPLVGFGGSLILGYLLSLALLPNETPQRPAARLHPAVARFSSL